MFNSHAQTKQIVIQEGAQETVNEYLHKRELIQTNPPLEGNKKTYKTGQEWFRKAW